MALKDKLIAFDIDGTLARSNAFPSDYSYDVITKLVNDGYKIILVTGRSIVSSIEIYKRCHLKEICVLCNGALVYDPIKNIKYRNITIPMQILNDLLANQEIMSMVLDVLVEIDYKSYALTGKGWPNVDIIGDFKKTLPSAPNTMVIMAKDHKYQERIAQLINTSNNDYHYRYWNVVGEFYNLNFSKKEGVDVLLKLYNKSAKDLIFFGDGENDAELLSYANIGIAMKNAEFAAKICADEITMLTNDEDGAVKHLLKMIEMEK